MSTTPIEYMSFGGGPPSLALAILNAWNEITPRAELIVFADTGGEKAATYRLTRQYEAWLEEHGMEFRTVQSKDGPLEEYVRAKSVPIPVHTEGAIGKRQCTDKWKIAPIEQYLHARFGKGTPLIAQLALTWDAGDFNRQRDPKVKRNTNRWPLIEKRLTRANCIEIIQLAGLEVPPWTACSFCPLQGDGMWRQLASDHKEDFARAVSLDDFVSSRGGANGKGPVWLHWQKRPLSQVYSDGQSAFPLDAAGCDSGHCFT